jgi:hypothetical protein
MAYVIGKPCVDAMPLPRTRRDPSQCRVPDPPGAHARSSGKLGGFGRRRSTGRVRRTGFMSGPPHAERNREVSIEAAITVAITFAWLGMVLAISFLKAPLEFRARNVILQIGLGIGRLALRALNSVEVVFAIVVAAVTWRTRHRPGHRRVLIAFAVLAAQPVAVRPFLNCRSDKVLAGLNAPGDQDDRISGYRDSSATQSTSTLTQWYSERSPDPQG